VEIWTEYLSNTSLMRYRLVNLPCGALFYSLLKS
jgi:hypothetical protein